MAGTYCRVCRDYLHTRCPTTVVRLGTGTVCTDGSKSTGSRNILIDLVSIFTVLVVVDQPKNICHAMEYHGNPPNALREERGEKTDTALLQFTILY